MAVRNEYTDIDRLFQLFSVRARREIVELARNGDGRLLRGQLLARFTITEQRMTQYLQQLRALGVIAGKGDRYERPIVFIGHEIMARFDAAVAVLRARPVRPPGDPDAK